MLFINALKIMKSCTKSLITWKVLCLDNFVKICYSATISIANMMRNFGVYPNSLVSNNYFLTFQYLP